MNTGNERRSRHLRKSFPLLRLILLSLLAVPASAQQEPPLPAVVVERIALQPTSQAESFTARVEAIESVDIRARVQGFLQTIAFAAGQQVTAGALLFEIQPEQYEAAVALARAQVSQAQASQREATRNLARMRELSKQQSVSRAALDEAQAAADIAAANVEAAQARLRSAELDLSYTHITAPIDGEIGRSLFTQGNLVGPDAGPLARIIQADPIRVVFSIPEGLLVTLRQQMSQPGALDPAALRLTLRLPNDTPYPHPGRLEYIASEVNPQTGTVPVRVVFPNPERLLTPNQFVTLFARESEAQERPVVPQSAVLQDRNGRFVFLLGDGDVVTQHRIDTGARVTNGWVVTKGLGGGELVVVQGTQRLSEGARVQPTQGQPVGTDAP